MRPAVRRSAAAALALVALLGTASCSSSGSTGGSAAVSATPGAHVGPAAFASSMTQPGVVVLDVRTPAEFAAGHLQGAVNVDIEAADGPARLASLDPKASYAVYCRTGRRSGIALTTMASGGVTNAWDLEGGIVAWEADGQPVVTGA